MYNVFAINNGLRIVVENIEHVNSVSIGLWIENGSRNETTKNNGISHFIEHMFFKGTKNRTARELAEAIENVGGQLNAFTGKEATCYYVNVLNSHLELSLDVLSDMMFNSTFNEEDIEKEKSVVIEEINMGEDSPEDVLSDLHSFCVWGDDSISYPILGTENTVRSFNKDMIKKYIYDNYTPNRSVISICGNIKKYDIEKLIEKYFSKWKSNNNNNSLNYSSPKMLENIEFKEKSIEQVHFCLGLKGLPIGHENIYSLLLANNVFGGTVSSYLFQKVREEMGLCYNIYSYNSSYINTGALNIYTGVSPKYLYDTIYVIKEEIYNFCKKGINEFNLSIAKEQIKGNYILGLESTSSRMFANGRSILFLNKIYTQEDIIKKIDNIDRNSLSKVMDETFNQGIYNCSLVGKQLDLDKIKSII